MLSIVMSTIFTQRGTPACPLVVSETLLHRRLVSVRSIQRGDAIRGKWLNPKRSSPPALPAPAAKYLPMRPCLENWNRFSRFTAASSSLLSHWPNQHLLLRAQSCSVKRHQWRHGWFCHCLHARVFCFASVNGKWI
jgi:hypothetical protein